MAAEPADLTQRALDGDRDAFTQLVRNHQRLALGVAHSVLRDPGLAADAVQDAFVKAYQGLSQLREVDRFQSWFLAIVRTSAMDVARRRQRTKGREVALGAVALDHRREIDSTASPPDEVLLRDEESDRIRAAFDRLTPEYREVLLLKHAEELSYLEIAKMLDTSVRAVESRLQRARLQLQSQLRATEPDLRRAKGREAD